MFRSLLIFLFICCNIIMYAQQKEFVYADSTLINAEPEETDGAYEEDENSIDTTLYVRTIDFPKDRVTGWQMNPKFSYVKNLDSLLKAQQQEELKASKKTNNDGTSSFLVNLLTSGFIRILFWIIAISFVLFILYRLFIINGIFRRNSSSNAVKEITSEEQDIELSDFDGLIHQSFKLADYRMAVRYLFLKTLRRLSERGLVNKSADKTNFQYVQEIATGKRSEFASLVLNYEYVWYGHLNINREQYEGIEKSYTSFYNKI